MIFEKHEVPFNENEAFAIELLMSKIAGRSWVSPRIENNTFIIECTPGDKHTAYEIFKKDEGTWVIVYHRGHYVIRKTEWNMYKAGDFMEMLRFLVEQKDVTLD